MKQKIKKNSLSSDLSIGAKAKMEVSRRRRIKTIFVIPLYTILGGLLGYFLSWLIALILFPNSQAGLSYIYTVILFIIIGLILGIIIGIKRSRT
ncbi:MAG: hypothetical protein WC663_03930 [Patescibacteria group bacterium]|jgi:H+/Cl- antiporter ClcA